MNLADQLRGIAIAVAPLPDGGCLGKPGKPDARYRNTTSGSRRQKIHSADLVLGIAIPRLALADESHGRGLDIGYRDT